VADLRENQSLPVRGGTHSPPAPAAHGGLLPTPQGQVMPEIRTLNVGEKMLNVSRAAYAGAPGGGRGWVGGLRAAGVASDQ
jgi:hypothetical protein